jgi:hypothetical protein
MVDRAYIVSAYRLEELCKVGAVEMLMRPHRCSSRERHYAHIRGYHGVTAVTLAQSRDELGANLTERARDQDGS